VASGTHQRATRREAHQPSQALTPFEVVCACGRAVRGQRRSRHQVVPCPNCGEALFILPRGAWGPGGKVTPTAPASGAARRLLWRLGLAALAAAVLGTLVLYLTLGRFLSRRPTESAAGPPPIRERFESGRQALAAGHFRRARHFFDEAQGMRQQAPEGLTADEFRELPRLQRQAELLSALMALSLQEVLHQGRRVHDDQEWETLFAEQYRGRSVVFDDVVRRNAAGWAELAVLRVLDDNEPARLALEDLTLWQRVPLDPPPRLLFGARLSRMGREEGGAWVVRFEPDSGVLLTDPGAAAAVCPAPLSAELREVLRRQTEWDRP
jgi:hypothetical protein